jgi:DNA-binding transcriptional LysR family regulator
MNLADLQAFIQIYQTKNISRAAEQLNMTQSALSKRLHTIQNIVGVTLVST